MDESNKILLPTQEEKDRAIGAILDQGLTRPMGLARRARTLPVGALFFGVGDAVFLAVLLTLLCLVPAALAAAQQSPLAPVLFLFSPFLYGALQSLTLWKEAQCGTLEWKQTCRVSFRVVAALRMLCFGGASVLVSVGACVLLWTLSGRTVSLLWLLGLSCSSLFLYAALSLALESLGRWRGILTPPLLWIGLGMGLMLWERGAELLLRVPAWVFLLVAAGSLAAFLAGLDRRLRKQREGDGRYAVC